MYRDLARAGVSGFRAMGSQLNEDASVLKVLPITTLLDVARAGVSGFRAMGSQLNEDASCS